MGLLDTRTHLAREMDQLMTLANQKNGHDNITAIAVRMRPQKSLSPSSELGGSAALTDH